MSFVSPEIPRSPDCVLRSISTSWGDRPSFVAMRFTIAGSISPERVPITSPSSGVMPMEVSTGYPARIAAAEQPLPRCSVMTCVCSRVKLRKPDSGKPHSGATFREIRSGECGAAVQMVGQGIQVGLLRQGMMECRVEDGDLRNFRPQDWRAARMHLMLLGL